MQKKELFTVGELAHDMGITVRALQYYDKEGVLKPSAKSGGGRRIYTSKDKVRLHQILSMKYLGFSLDEIKNNLMGLDSPAEVCVALDRQAGEIREQLDELSEALSAIEALKKEVSAMQTVDFDKYADIIALLRLKNEHYWVVRCFDEKLNNHIRQRFEDCPELGDEIYARYQAVCEETIRLKEQGEDPAGEEGQKTAQKWWAVVTDFTGGDMSLLPELMKFNENKDQWDSEVREKQRQAETFIEAALGVYFQNNQIEFPEDIT